MECMIRVPLTRFLGKTKEIISYLTDNLFLIDAHAICIIYLIIYIIRSVWFYAMRKLMHVETSGYESRIIGYVFDWFQALVYG